MITAESLVVTFLTQHLTNIVLLLKINNVENILNNQPKIAYKFDLQSTTSGLTKTFNNNCSNKVLVYSFLNIKRIVFYYLQNYLWPDLRLVNILNTFYKNTFYKNKKLSKLIQLKWLCFGQKPQYYDYYQLFFFFDNKTKVVSM